MDAIVTFLMERWPVLAAIIIAVVITIMLCKWYYGRFVQIETKTEKNEKQLEDLPCAQHEKQIYSIRDFLYAKYPKAFGPYMMQKKSPCQLSEEGERIFEEIGGGSFLEANGQRLIDEMERKRPQTPFDVELFARSALLDMLSDPAFNEIKRWVYDAPMRKQIISGVEKEYVVSIDDVIFVLSIPLRDLFLKFHPELV
jgi:hypothetical protein